MAKLYAPNKDESARLFKSDLLEFFTHVHWSVPIFLYVPVVSYFLYRASNTPGVTLGTGAVLFAAGLVVWSFSEYILHRYVFHYEPSSALGKRLHFLMHGIHHDYPNDSTRLVLPPSMSIPLAALFYGLFFLLFGAQYVAPFYAAFLLGYVLYDEIHYATHHAPMKGSMFLKLKHHHILHHYHAPEKGYGVSSPLWDYVFGTLDPTEEKTPAEA